MNSGPLLIAEDMPGPSVHAGPRSLAYRVFLGLFGASLRRAVRAERPSCAVVPEALVGGLAGQAPSTKFVTPNLLLSKSWALVDYDAAYAFHRRLLDRYVEKSRRLPRGDLEALGFRALLPALLEYVGRPAEGLHHFLSGWAPGELALLTGAGSFEATAGDVARALGWRVRASFWGLLVAPLFRVRAALRDRSDGLPSLERLGAPYVPAPGDDTTGGLVFFCPDERRIRRFARLIRALVASGMPTRLAVFSSKRETKLAAGELSGGLPVDAVNGFFSGDAAALRSGAGEARRAWGEALAGDPALESMSYKGVRFAPFCRRRLTRSWGKLAYETELFGTACRSYLRVRKPKLVVMADQSLYSLLVAQACDELGIPTVSYVYNPILFTVEFWRRSLLDSLRGTHFFTATGHMADVLARAGKAPREQIRVVGDIFGDLPARGEREEIRASVRGKLGLGSGDRVVLALSFFVGQDISETQKRRFLRTVGASVEGCPGAKLVVKAHPNEDRGLLARMLEEEGVRVAHVAHLESLRDLLLASDAACMVFSQAGLEAVMAGVPLIVVQDPGLLEGYEGWVPYVRDGAAEYVSDAEPFAARLRAVVTPGEARDRRLEAAARFREKYITPAGVEPVPAMAEALRELSR